MTRPHVLIVEDDPIHRQVLAALVAQSRFDATYTADGSAALELIERGGLAAIILDLRIPEIDGFSIIDRLRETDRETLRRIVVVTGLAEDELRRLDQSEVGGVLRKPLDLTQFRNVLASCIRV